MLIVFRVDSSNIIGAGHLVRCLNLATQIKKYLKRRDLSVRIIFLCRPYDGNCAYLIHPSSEVIWMTPPSFQVMRGLPNTWLGKTVEEDVNECIELLKTNVRDGNIGEGEGGNRTIDLLVVDHYATNLEWESLFRSNCEIGKILAIDDDNHRKHQVDFLLNHAIPDDVFKLSRLQELRKEVLRSSPQQMSRLMGPDYALINSCFFERRQQIGHDQLVRCHGIRRIQISFGGSDPTHETAHVVRFLLQYTDILKRYRFDIILGFNVSDIDEEIIRTTIGAYDNVSVYKGIDQHKIAKLLSKTDICIGGGGVSMYERCCLGVPSIIIVIAGNQIINTLQLKGLGVIHYLGQSGSWTDSEMIDSLKIMSQNLEQMSRNCLEILPENSYVNICQKLFKDFDIQSYTGDHELQKIPKRIDGD